MEGKKEKEEPISFYHIKENPRIDRLEKKKEFYPSTEEGKACA